MFKIVKITVFPLLLLVLSNCEKVLPYAREDDDRLEINVLADPDTTLSMYVFRTFSASEAEVTSMMITDYWKYVLASNYNADSLIRKDVVLSNAQAKVTVNGAEEHQLRYDPEKHNYTCGYRPKEGDMLRFEVTAVDYPPVAAEVSVPQARRLEILGTRKFIDSKWTSGVHTEEGVIDWGTDTVMSITLRLTDPASERNYYRLKIRSAGEYRNEAGELVYYSFSDVFNSSDVIFADENLVEGCWGWPANFSNVFDDRIFDGTSYTFTVESRQRFGENPHVVVELQSITPELYYYLKSIMLYRITDQDSYTEAIQIYSNVDNGWGIAGGISGEKQIIYF